jgi:hypothetical protein
MNAIAHFCITLFHNAEHYHTDDYDRCDGR